MTLILDAGALIALERSDRDMWIRIKAAHEDGAPPRTHAGVLGQVWRGHPTQARLAKALAGIAIAPLDESFGRAAGKLLAQTRTSDVIDAAVIAMSSDGDEIATSDPGDLVALAAASGRFVELIRI